MWNSHFISRPSILLLCLFISSNDAAPTAFVASKNATPKRQSVADSLFLVSPQMSGTLRTTYCSPTTSSPIILNGRKSTKRKKRVQLAPANHVDKWQPFYERLKSYLEDKRRADVLSSSSSSSTGVSATSSSTATSSSSSRSSSSDQSQLEEDDPELAEWLKEQKVQYRYLQEGKRVKLTRVRAKALEQLEVVTEQ